jgi:hypothetical protein
MFTKHLFIELKILMFLRTVLTHEESRVLGCDAMFLLLEAQEPHGFTSQKSPP